MRCQGVPLKILVTLKQILSGKLHTLLYRNSKTWGSSCIESSTILTKIGRYLCIQFFRSWFLSRWFSWCFGAGYEQLVHYSLLSFLPAATSSFPRMASPSARCAFFKIALLSSSFLLMAIHACILLLCLIQKPPQCGLVQWKYSSHCRCCHKICRLQFLQQSIFFTIWWIWNSRILPDIVWRAFYPFDTAICISNF